MNRSEFANLVAQANWNGIMTIQECRDYLGVSGSVQGCQDYLGISGSSGGLAQLRTHQQATHWLEHQRCPWCTRRYTEKDIVCAGCGAPL